MISEAKWRFSWDACSVGRAWQQVESLTPLGMPCWRGHPGADVPANSPSRAQPSGLHCQAHDMWSSHAGPSTPAHPPTGHSWVTLINAMGSGRISQRSPTQILDRQNPGAMKNGCYFKPLSIREMCCATLNNQKESHPHTQTQHVCTAYVCVREKFFVTLNNHS